MLERLRGSILNTWPRCSSRHMLPFNRWAWTNAVLTLAALVFYVVVAPVTLTSLALRYRFAPVQIVSRHPIEPSVGRNQLILSLQRLSVPVRSCPLSLLIQFFLKEVKIHLNLSNWFLIFCLFLLPRFLFSSPEGLFCVGDDYSDLWLFADFAGLFKFVEIFLDDIVSDLWLRFNVPFDGDVIDSGQKIGLIDVRVYIWIGSIILEVLFGDLPLLVV